VVHAGDVELKVREAKRRQLADDAKLKHAVADLVLDNCCGTGGHHHNPLSGPDSTGT